MKELHFLTRCVALKFENLLIQWNSVNKSTSGQPVLDLIRGGFNKRRFLKCTRRFRSKQIGCNKRLDLLTVDLLTEFHCIETLLLRIEQSQLRWFGHVSRMPQERLPKHALLAKANGRRPVGRPRTRWTNYIEDLG